MKIQLFSFVVKQRRLKVRVNNMLKLITTFTFILLLNACAIKVTEKTTYTLADTTQVSHQNVNKRITLLVSMPNSNPGYETKHMIYTLKPYELSTFSTHQWAGSPAQMLFPLLIQHIDNTGYLQAIAAPSLSTYKNKLLKTQLLEFHHDFTTHPSSIKMSIRADIIDKANDYIISTQVFSTQMHALSDTPYGGVIAFNQASHRLLDQIAWYCVENLISEPAVIIPPPKWIKQHKGRQS